jgi:hypothetical protein
VTVTVAVRDRVPLAPVTVTAYVPAGVEAVVEIVSVEVPVEPGVRLILVGAKAKVIPVAVGATVAESATLPVKPRLLAVIVEVADPPAAKLAGVAALAEIAKSPTTVTVTVAVWEVVPLEPVTVTVYGLVGVDAVVAIVRVLVPVEPAVRLTLGGLNVNVMPVAAGATVADSATLPVNPWLVRVMVEVAKPPAVKLSGVAAPAAIVRPASTVGVTVEV